MIALHRFMGACPLAAWDRTFEDPQDIAQFFLLVCWEVMSCVLEKVCGKWMNMFNSKAARWERGLIQEKSMDFESL